MHAKAPLRLRHCWLLVSERVLGVCPRSLWCNCRARSGRQKCSAKGDNHSGLERQLSGKMRLLKSHQRHSWRVERVHLPFVNCRFLNWLLPSSLASISPSASLLDILYGYQRERERERERERVCVWVCENLSSFAHPKTLNLWLYMRLLSIAAQTYGSRCVR